MATSSSSDQEPLLSGSSSSNPSRVSSYESITKSLSSLEDNPEGVQLDRSIETDVLPESSALGRKLGWSSAYILIISRVIGSGIFATPGSIVRSVGSIGLSLTLWVVGAIISWCGLAVLLEYGCMLPRSGGDKVYLEFTYRHPKFLASTLIAIQSVLLGFTALNCIAFGEYVLFALGIDVTEGLKRSLALGLLTTIIAVHTIAPRAGIFIQNVLGWVKIALIISMIFISLFVVAFRRQEDFNSTPAPGADPRPSAHFGGIWEGTIWNWGIVSSALFKVFYSYAGLHNVNNVLNEVRDPVRTLKSAAMAGLVTACILYLLVNIAYFLVVPLDEIKNSGELIAALFFERVFGHAIGRVILPLAVATSAAGNVMVVTFSHARINQEIARQGFLPYASLLSTSKPFNSPIGGLITHYIPSALIILVPSKDLYSYIIDVEGYPSQIFATATTLGLLWLRYRRPDLKRPYRAFLPAVFLRLAMSLALLVAPFVPRGGLNWRQHIASVSYVFVGTGILLFGTLYWYLWFRLLPRWYGYEVVEAFDVLEDGTTITKLVKVPKSDGSQDQHTTQ